MVIIGSALRSLASERRLGRNLAKENTVRGSSIKTVLDVSISHIPTDHGHHGIARKKKNRIWGTRKAVKRKRRTTPLGATKLGASTQGVNTEEEQTC